MKTSELTGAALNWAVEHCEGWGHAPQSPDYSTDWSQAGPIIEREGLSLAKVGRSLDDVIAPHPDCWCAHLDGSFSHYATTPLIAAMRCYVASKLGVEVYIPDGLA